MKTIIVYTDGSSLGNPGPGGWAFSYKDDTRIVMVSGGVMNTTNNRMELLAVIEALEWLPHDNLHVVSDSKLTIEIGRGNWKRKSNLDLWERFETARSHRSIEWEWVKAHNGNKENERVDTAARDEARRLLV